jgi:hypothetical protein
LRQEHLNKTNQPWITDTVEGISAKQEVGGSMEKSKKKAWNLSF